MSELIIVGAEDLTGLIALSVFRKLTDIKIEKFSERMICIDFDGLSGVDLMFSTTADRDAAYEKFMKDKNDYS